LAQFVSVSDFRFVYNVSKEVKGEHDVQIIVKLFAGAAEAAGAREVDIVRPSAATLSLAEMKADLAARYPALRKLLDTAWCARNDEYVTAEATLHDGDVIAIIPPVSGGADSRTQGELDVSHLAPLAIVDSPLLPSQMHAYVTDPGAGAVVVFAGTVREFTRGRQTLRLQYEAYEQMALTKLEEVVKRAREQWPIIKMAIWHRTGTLDLTDISVLIGVCTAHRHDAFEAAEYAIKTLKQIVPIWKKEFFADGTEEWMGPDGPWNPKES